MDDQDKRSVTSISLGNRQFTSLHNMKINNYLLAGYVNIFEYNKKSWDAMYLHIWPSEA